jgi:hypothetical protein
MLWREKVLESSVGRRKEHQLVVKVITTPFPGALALGGLHAEQSACISHLKPS